VNTRALGVPLALRLEAYTTLSEEERVRINRMARRSLREVPARRDIIREGEPPRSAFILLEGWACRYKTLPDGRRQMLALFIPGDVGDVHASILSQMDHSIGAITAVKVAEVSREELEQLMAEHPRVRQGLLRDELVTVAVQREWTLNVGQRTAYERISHFLCEIFFRLRAVGLTDGHSCDFPLTQGDIADATGLTAVHVNRTLQDLRREGVLELQGRKLSIPNLDALMGACSFNPNYLHLCEDREEPDGND